MKKAREENGIDDASKKEEEANKQEDEAMETFLETTRDPARVSVVKK